MGRSTSWSIRRPTERADCAPDINLNDHGIKGIGLASGAQYELPGEHHSIENFNAGNAYTASNSDNTRLIGQGPDNNELFAFEYHLTVTPDGAVTASFTNFGVTCH